MLLAVFVLAVALQSPSANCAEPQACRELALEARARGAHETFHDFAWRAVQTGSPTDPESLYLLARAQALSGRRRDAIVTLRRLAEAGVANDAATEEDFRRVRELPDWPYIASLATRARPATPSATAKPEPTAKPPAPSAAATASAAKPTPAPIAPIAPIAPAGATIAPIAPAGATIAPIAPAGVTVAPIAPAGAAVAPIAPAPAPVANALRVERARVEDAVRFATSTFTPAGLAYDAVSRRFLFGDLAGRRLFVAGEGSDRTVDLVRADSAGFEDVTAITLDARRGELWVASTAA